VTKLALIQVKSFSILLGIGLSTWACGGDNESASLSSPTAPASQATYTVSGVITEMATTRLAPLGGVSMFINGRRGTTDDQGFYSIPGVEGLSFGNSITATKAGYKAETTNLTLKADTRVDFQLIRTAIYTLSGVVAEQTSTGLVPIAGVRVEEYSMPCDERGTGCVGFGGAEIGIVQNTTTDKNGFYSIPGVYPGNYNFIWAGKDGFEDPYPPRPAAPEGGRDLSIDGNTRFDILLIRR